VEIYDYGVHAGFEYPLEMGVPAARGLKDTNPRLSELEARIS